MHVAVVETKEYRATFIPKDFIKNVSFKDERNVQIPRRTVSQRLKSFVNEFMKITSLTNLISRFVHKEPPPTQTPRMYAF